jgi:hypothetical protein
MMSYGHNERVGSAMQVLGFKRSKMRFGKDTAWCYFRGDSAGCVKVFVHRINADNPPVWRASLIEDAQAFLDTRPF